MMISRTEAEHILRALVGGSFPDEGETILFSRDAGFQFGTPTGSATLDFHLYTLGWFIVASLDSAAKPFGYRFIVDTTTVYQSISVSYNAGAGVVSYTADITGFALHTLKQTGGATDFVAANSQTAFDITITPYTGTGGGGTAGAAVTINTGDAMRSGRGVSVEKSTGSVLTGNFYKLPPHLDADLDSSDDYEPLGRLKTSYNAGSQSGNWTPNYLTSPTQRVTASAALTLYDLSNMPSGGVMNLHFTLNSTYDLTIESTNFEGPTLLFSGVDYVALTVVDFGLSKYVIAGVSY